ncbi:MAG: hypothetical protein ACREMB_02610, partial [Candidatus Rokuibacteriota bacterium]
TWEGVREYELAVLDVLARLAHDPVPEVRREAQSGAIDGFRQVVGHSVLENGLHRLRTRALDLLEEIATESPSASCWARIVTQLELLLDDLTRRPATSATANAAGRVRGLKSKLTEADLTARLWHWAGPGSHSSDEKWLEDVPGVTKTLESLAGELVADQVAFTQHLPWLLADEAKHRFPLFQVLGARDRGGPVLAALLTEVDSPYWPEGFGAYCQGWAGKEPREVESALDRLAGDPRLHRGVLVATAWMPSSPGGVDRLVRLAGGGTIVASEMVADAVRNVQWDRLTASEAERLLLALDDGTPAVRSELLLALLVRERRGAEMTPALRELAWDLLRSTSPVQQRTGPHTWDALAAKLGKQEPGRLLTLVEQFLVDPVSAPELRLEDDLPLSWRLLQGADHAGALRMLLRLALQPAASWRVQWQISRMLRPDQDRDLILGFLEEGDGRAAALVAENLDPESQGFWDLARELIIRSAGDDVVTDSLLGRLGGGAWSGSAVHMIDRRLEGAQALLNDKNARVAAWARKAVRQLDEWRRREAQQDEEGWIWDHRVPRRDLEAMLARHGAPERLWAIGRLLEDAPPGRVSELLSPQEILEALPKLEHLDRRTREKWQAWARHRSRSD